MHRRRVLSLVSATAVPGVAGCITWTGSGESVLAERGAPRLDNHLSRPRPPAQRPRDADEDTVAPIWYPGEPASYTSRSVRSFVERYERSPDPWESGVVLESGE